MDTSGWNMYVFRDGRRILSGCELLKALREAIASAAVHPQPEMLIGALLAAGELGCALADAGSPYTPPINEITDQLAEALLVSSRGQTARVDAPELAAKLEAIAAPQQLRISVQEGFAYYALHPLKFAQVLDGLTLPKQVAVVGIRSIGLTLSAVTLAALRLRGHDAGRISVRPTGHPYDRVVELNSEQQAWVAERPRATFLVVDEGPGLSGSSFLATAEALVRAGVPAKNVVLIGTRLPDVSVLRTQDAAARWAKFQAVAVDPAPLLPLDAGLPLGGGAWRREFLGESAEHPGSWTQLERLKYLASDGKRIYRFEGFGHYGRDHGQRARSLAEAGFGPPYLGNFNGFGCYEFVNGQPLDERSVTTNILDRIAGYCAFRAKAFPEIADQPSELEQMLRFNWKNEFGTELDGGITLEARRVIVTDSRMMPHKWLRTTGGEILKVDSTSHGDDHFFPGPCDIAWDLAGAIVEWRLSREAEDYFLQSYTRLSGDHVLPRIENYLLAYATFRLAYARMAARAMGGSPEEPLLVREYQRYRQQALEIHGRKTGASGESQPAHAVGALTCTPAPAA